MVRKDGLILIRDMAVEVKNMMDFKMNAVMVSDPAYDRHLEPGFRLRMVTTSYLCEILASFHGPRFGALANLRAAATRLYNTYGVTVAVTRAKIFRSISQPPLATRRTLCVYDSLQPRSVSSHAYFNVQAPIRRPICRYADMVSFLPVSYLL